MARKHVRTKFNRVLFTRDDKTTRNLKPGGYQINERDGSYVGSFIIYPDHTIDFYGGAMDIRFACSKIPPKP